MEVRFKPRVMTYEPSDVDPPPSEPRTGRLRILWTARSFPFPLDAGDRVYSANLAAATAVEGIDIVYVALATNASLKRTDCDLSNEIIWKPAICRRRDRVLCLFSSLPLAAAEFSPSCVRRAFANLLEHEIFDAVIIDNYASGWSLKYLKKLNKTSLPIIYVAHNAESDLADEIYKSFRGALLKKILLYINAKKIRKIERDLLDRSSAVLTLTPKDTDSLRRSGNVSRFLTLSPGYSGPRVESRCIDADVPRSVVMLGSLTWIARQINVSKFLSVADKLFASNKISLLLVGRVDPNFKAECEQWVRATRFLGFQEDLSSVLAAVRMGLVIDEVGGGFKLKLLDYVFTRTPIAALTASLAGIPDEMQANCICRNSVEDLVQAVVSEIDNLELLNQMQDRCFNAGVREFEWSSRGRKFADLLLGLAAAK